AQKKQTPPQGVTLVQECGGEPYFGTEPERLWLLRSRPDQFHRRPMRRDPPLCILASFTLFVGKLPFLHQERRINVDPVSGIQRKNGSRGGTTVQLRQALAIPL